MNKEYSGAFKNIHLNSEYVKTLALHKVHKYLTISVC
jgi:hypothetical protein